MKVYILDFDSMSRKIHDRLILGGIRTQSSLIATSSPKASCESVFVAVLVERLGS
jgi:hypothetical protein